MAEDLLAHDPDRGGSTSIWVAGWLCGSATTAAPFRLASQPENGDAMVLVDRHELSVRHTRTRPAGH